MNLEEVTINLQRNRIYLSFDALQPQELSEIIPAAVRCPENTSEIYLGNKQTSYNRASVHQYYLIFRQGQGETHFHLADVYPSAQASYETELLGVIYSYLNQNLPASRQEVSLHLPIKLKKNIRGEIQESPKCSYPVPISSLTPEGSKEFYNSHKKNV